MTIISLANSMFAPPALRPQQSNCGKDDRLDAAHALLGVFPFSSAHGATTFEGVPRTCDHGKPPARESLSSVVPRRPRSNSAGLDALAFLATKEQASMESQTDSAPELVSRPLVANAVSSSSSDDDSEAMPPPPPRTVTTRRRSVSNPEGMEKWVPNEHQHHRMHFVLPASILEEELAEASAAMKAKQENNQRSQHTRIDTILEEDEENLDEDELLRRARSRLLEDLSEGNMNADKGGLTLPHALPKYKDVYSKNGRIGIYTPAERAAIISKFHGKRARRVWNKKIRYNCRKNLADRRMRVKGRFVKRSTEQQAREQTESTESEDTEFKMTNAASVGTDSDMPDVTDPEAGFCPTADQPYRRARRHTIT